MARRNSRAKAQLIKASTGPAAQLVTAKTGAAADSRSSARPRAEWN